VSQLSFKCCSFEEGGCEGAGVFEKLVAITPEAFVEVDEAAILQVA
jgi:hypothetical protein